MVTEAEESGFTMYSQMHRMEEIFARESVLVNIIETGFILLNNLTAYGCTADRWISGWMDVLYAASI